MYVLWFEFIYPWFKFYFQFISNLLSYITIPPKERKVKLGPKVKLGYNIRPRLFKRWIALSTG